MTLIIAHRGYHKNTPENTISAFKKALNLKVDGIEFDVRLTQDNVPIILHNKHLDKNENFDLVENKKYACIQKIKIKNEDIPTLGKTISFLKGKTKLFIELKCIPVKYVHLITDLIKQNKIIEEVVILSFYPKLLNEVKRINKKIKTCDLTFYLFKVTENYEYMGVYYKTLTKSMIDKLHKKRKKFYVFQLMQKKKFQTIK